MSDEDLTVRRAGGGATTSARCAYCHAALDPEPWTCAQCGATLHADCHEEAVHCPTPGCAASVWAVVKQRATQEAP
jgi:predicted amidophosphoribosyltransferase